MIRISVGRSNRLERRKRVLRCFVWVNLSHNFSVPPCLGGEIVILGSHHRGTEDNFSAMHCPHSLAKSQKKKRPLAKAREPGQGSVTAIAFAQDGYPVRIWRSPVALGIFDQSMLQALDDVLYMSTNIVMVSLLVLVSLIILISLLMPIPFF